ncbi:MAG: ATP-binding protein [Bacteroidales bacterium]|nr:ATP-binding protein [Bacteroidales bacterium]
MDNFVVENLGPIAKADVTFGDLTILTGPQASGKTLFLETFKLVQDLDNIVFSFIDSNYSRDKNAFLDYFYGDKMHKLFSKKFRLQSDGIGIGLLLLQIFSKNKEFKQSEYNRVFYIPAQRSLALSEGRIKTPDDFINSPYVLLKFSNYLQKYVKINSNRLVQDIIKDYEFLNNAEINMRRTAGSPRLEMTVDNQTVPYMAWSTGQREFTPLLMALDYFDTIDNKEYIVIEEPELGLHPRAIIEFMFTVLKLMKKGVKVIISTHSSTPLDFVWTMNRLKHKGVKSFAALAEMFDFKIKDKDFFDGLFEKEIKVYYFAPDKKTRKVHSKDISSLDVESEDEDISNWGGMSLSADRAGSIVSKF